MPPRPDLEFACKVLWSLFVVLISVPEPTRAGDLEWLSHADGAVYSVRLEVGATDLSWSEVTVTGYEGSSFGDALAPDGSLYSLGRRNINQENVWELLNTELEGGSYSSQTVGQPVRHLAIDDQGQLWTTSFGRVYRLETDGTLIPTPIALDNLLAIDWHDGVLYALSRPLPGVETLLIAADPLTGSSMPVAQLEGFIGICDRPDPPQSMAFDTDGGLWVNLAEIIFGCITIPGGDNAVLYFPDPFSGVNQPRQRLSPDLEPFLSGMTLRATPTAIEVPATRVGGLAVLFGALVLLGALRLRHI
jgi:hypothetical protein